VVKRCWVDGLDGGEREREGWLTLVLVVVLIGFDVVNED